MTTQNNRAWRREEFRKTGKMAVFITTLDEKGKPTKKMVIKEKKEPEKPSDSSSRKVRRAYQKLTGEKIIGTTVPFRKDVR